MKNDKPKLVKGITEKGIAVWPKLNVPDEYKGKKAYKADLILSEADAAGLIEKIEEGTAAIHAATIEQLTETTKTGKTGDAKAKAKKALAALTTGLPYSEAVDEDGNGTGNFNFKFKCNAEFEDKKTGKMRTITVPLFDSKGKPTKAAIWGGSTVRIAYALVPYYVASANQCGVSLRIEGVKVINLVSSGGGFSADSLGFGEEEDGYESESLTGDESDGDDSAGPSVDDVDDF